MTTRFLAVCDGEQFLRTDGNRVVWCGVVCIWNLMVHTVRSFFHADHLALFIEHTPPPPPPVIYDIRKPEGR